MRKKEEDIQKLKNYGLKMFNMSWSQYLLSVWTTHKERVDTVVPVPVNATNRSYSRHIRSDRVFREELDGDFVSYFILFCKTVVQPVVFVVLLIISYLHKDCY